MQPIEGAKEFHIILAGNRDPFEPFKIDVSHQLDGLIGKIDTTAIYQFSKSKQIIHILQFIHLLAFVSIIPTGVFRVGSAHNVSKCAVGPAAKRRWLGGSIDRHIVRENVLKLDLAVGLAIDTLGIALCYCRRTAFVYQCHIHVRSAVGLGQLQLAHFICHDPVAACAVARPRQHKVLGRRCLIKNKAGVAFSELPQHTA